MAMDLEPDLATDRLEVLDSVKPRLADLADGRDLDELINRALDDLTPANVTTYLPILVERNVRARVHHSPPA